MSFLVFWGKDYIWQGQTVHGWDSCAEHALVLDICKPINKIRKHNQYSQHAAPVFSTKKLSLGKKNHTPHCVQPVIACDLCSDRCLWGLPPLTGMCLFKSWVDIFTGIFMDQQLQVVIDLVRISTVTNHIEWALCFYSLVIWALWGFTEPCLIVFRSWPAVNVNSSFLQLWRNQNAPSFGSWQLMEQPDS